MKLPVAGKGFILALCLLSFALNAQAAGIALGAAPKGDPKNVASKIIKKNFGKKCRNVSKAVRMSDGTIQASCGASDYRVFTMFNAEEGRLMELALNCTAAEEMGVSCYK